MDVSFYAALTAQTGTIKVYPVLAPENATAPFIVYQRTGTQRDIAVDGTTGLVIASYRIDVYSTSLKAAQNIADDIVRGLSQHATAPINYIRIDNEFDASDLSGDPKLFRIIAEVDVHFSPD
ncbi:hypothetical protein A0J57_20120 [Sphingobium sp. 22B]|uniref:tail completion protein gp17 n=1 Tax=unclassified Sphingobium TaxID=2611147 RepID=UPI0007805A44|nr:MULTISPECIES: DUF3168 domain-containing protein [unclassified Sphingobium]KXU30653.1 hypothetical protein AXW74_16710 [Sphingobium sp. AM]KYC30546.1 hypothetical protein A0J57_20120 [Sphingobium sp. 22B]OAP30266.1 hypothetical protein A8O16_19425 [Sphingobium sp. 20006FA]